MNLFKKINFNKVRLFVFIWDMIELVQFLMKRLKTYIVNEVYITNCTKPIYKIERMSDTQLLSNLKHAYIYKF